MFVTVTVVVEPGVELDSPETEQWVKDRFEAWRLKPGSRVAAHYKEAPPTGEATELELGELESAPRG